MDALGSYDLIGIFESHSVNLSAKSMFDAFFNILKVNIFYFSKLVNVKVKKREKHKNCYTSELRNIDISR